MCLFRMYQKDGNFHIRCRIEDRSKRFVTLLSCLCLLLSVDFLQLFVIRAVFVKRQRKFFLVVSAVFDGDEGLLDFEPAVYGPIKVM